MNKRFTDRIETVLEKLIKAEIASCSCMTKTHDYTAHDDECLYRVLA